MAEMKHYIDLCLKGQSTIPERKIMLEGKRRELVIRQEALQAALDYIAWKQSFHDDVLSGKAPYVSNLIAENQG